MSASGIDESMIKCAVVVVVVVVVLVVVVKDGRSAQLRKLCFKALQYKIQ